MTKRRKLWLQVLAVIIVFYAAIMVFGTLAMYSSSRNTYLSAKNEMIAHDLERVCFYTSTTFGYSWFFDYAWDHAQEINDALFSEAVMASPPPDAPLFESEDEAARYYSTLPADKQLSYAVHYFYEPLKAEMNFESTKFDYGGLFCIGLREDSECILYYNAGKLDENYLLRTDDNNIGESWDFDIEKHPAAEELLSGDYDEAAFEIAPSDWSDGKRYYIGYMPMVYNNKIKAVFAIDYNWEGFHTQLIFQIRLFIGLMFLGMVISCALLMLLINRIAIKPLSTVQKSVRQYIKDKDSDEALDELRTVRSRNEIGVLSDDITALVREMHEYTFNIKELTREVMEALAHTIDAKDRYTNGHSFRVAQYSKMLAERLDLSKKEQEDIYYMGLLHDIGKIGIPNSIINKPARLTEEEFEIVKKHPVLGYEILVGIRSMPELSTGARYHHERVDGKGYPDGLKGEEIPYLARIIAVADSYDTMTSNRSYRKYLPQAVVRSEIEKNIGTQFDPAPATMMLRIIDEDREYKLHE